MRCINKKCFNNDPEEKDGCSFLISFEMCSVKELDQPHPDKQSEGELLPYEHKLVVMEGLLEVERVPYVNPIDCTCGCDINKHLTPHLVGLTTRKTGATSLYSLESTLEKLNGKTVKITVEWS
jgi:hypothetical protein